MLVDGLGINSGPSESTQPGAFLSVACTAPVLRGLHMQTVPLLSRFLQSICNPSSRQCVLLQIVLLCDELRLDEALCVEYLITAYDEVGVCVLGVLGTKISVHQQHGLRTSEEVVMLNYTAALPRTYVN